MAGISKIPVVGTIAALAVTISVAAWQKYVDQYRRGGTRDPSKSVKASDVSMVGVDYENMITSGEIVFFSNPSRLQGLPRGISNTADIMEGVSRYRQRHQGSY